MGKGWIALNRSIQDCFIWCDKPYAKGQAWVDMLLTANHSPKKYLSKSEVVMVERGSFLTSDNILAERWGWGRKKVRSFLELLENESMIVTKRNSKGTIINIVNYSIYQDLETEKEHQKNIQGTSEEHPRNIKGTSKEHQKNTNNNDNNDNNEKNDKQCNNENNIDYQQIADMYNEICISFPRLSKLSDARKKAIKARLKTFSLADIQTVFEKAEASNFLKGGNDRNWSATFDWMLKDANMSKILDGNYDNKQQQKQSNNKSLLSDWDNW